MPTDRLGTNPAPLEDYPPAALCSLACLAFAIADHRIGLVPGRGDWTSWAALGEAIVDRLREMEPDEDAPQLWDDLGYSLDLFDDGSADLDECADGAAFSFFLYVDSAHYLTVWDWDDSAGLIASTHSACRPIR